VFFNEIILKKQFLGNCCQAKLRTYPRHIANVTGAQPVCMPVIQALAHALNQTTLKHWQFYSLLLGSTLVSAWAPCLGAGADGLLGDSAAAGQLHPTRCQST
jgi:hypothetical protein